MTIRAAVVREKDGLVLNVVILHPSAFSFGGDPIYAWASGSGELVVAAQEPDGTPRWVMPGSRYDAKTGAFFHPHLELPPSLTVGTQGMVVVQWRRHDGQPAPYPQPVTVEVLGERASYTPDNDGRIVIPFLAKVPGEYEVAVIEPELGIVLSRGVIVVS